MSASKSNKTKIAPIEDLAREDQSATTDNVAPFPGSTAANITEESETAEVSQDIMAEAVAAQEEADPYGNLMAEAVENPDDFGAGQPTLGAIPVRAPINGEYLRCHPTFCPRFHLYLSPYTRRTFLVFAKLVPLLGPDLCRLHTLRMLITPQNAPFIWPMKVGIAGSELSMTYARSRDSVVAEATKHWVSCMQTRGLWSTAPPLDPTIFPKESIWPAGDDNAWLALSWRGNVIDVKDHDEILYRQGVKLP